MNDTTTDSSGKPPTIDIAVTRQRGFAMAKALISGLADLDERIGFATETTVDDRLALLESARRLALLLDGGEVTR